MEGAMQISFEPNTVARTGRVFSLSTQAGCDCTDLCSKLKEQQKGQLGNWSKNYDVKIYQDKAGNAIAIASFDNSGDRAALTFKYEKTTDKFSYDGVGVISNAQEIKDGKQSGDAYVYKNNASPIEQYAGAKIWLDANPKANSEERKKREAIVSAKEAEGFKSSGSCIKL
jgi:hypothetical protein